MPVPGIPLGIQWEPRRFTYPTYYTKLSSSIFLAKIDHFFHMRRSPVLYHRLRETLIE